MNIKIVKVFGKSSNQTIKRSFHRTSTKFDDDNLTPEQARQKIEIYRELYHRCCKDVDKIYKEVVVPMNKTNQIKEEMKKDLLKKMVNKEK